MNTSRIQTINQCIEELSFVSIDAPFKQVGIFIKGKVLISFDALDTPLSFEVEIYPQYPFKYHNTETIRFINTNLLACKHVMGNGTICIHTSHSVELNKKLSIDFHSLKDWVLKYYINKEDDTHYEHLIVPQDTFKGSKLAFMFTEVDYEFKKHDYGYVNLSSLREGIINETINYNFIVQNFTNRQGLKLTSCKWSSYYKSLPNILQGIYVFAEKPPATYNRFTVLNWKEFTAFFRQDFIEFLHIHQKTCINRKQNDFPIPLFIGYKISDTEIHWQVALLEVGKFPIQGVREKNKVSTNLINETITWGMTRNSSYPYFFGRGAFSENMTTKKILIIGTGAIGSIVARTLVKSGCIKMDLCDYDIKEPENVCRAEFQFANGLASKVEELKNILCHISPFVEIGSVNQSYFDIVSKALFNEPKARQELEVFLNSYDMVFDCSADNDLMYVLNQLKLKCDVINLSITNKAQELVCAFYPNMYDFVTLQFSELLEQDTEDMYNPTGCWSPTFKASYNDINLLVQYGLKHINLLYRDGLSRNNFVIETSTETECKLELKAF